MYSIQTNKDIETDAIKIPGMLIQPFIENAIKHGLGPKEGMKELRINFSLQDEQNLLITIIDNGIGRQKAKQINERQQQLLPHESKGIALVKERLQLLNRQAADAINFEDLSNNGVATGTKVTLRIPVMTT